MQPLKLTVNLTIDRDFTKSPNLCDRLSVDDLQAIGENVWEGYQRDLESRSRWETRMNAAMDLAMQVSKAKNFPWPECSNVVFPLVTIAALQFSARSYGNLIHGTDVVKCRIPGEDLDGTVTKQADRISTHMSWQVFEEDESWEEQHDRLFINLAIVGSAFIKSYYCTDRQCPVSELVMSRDFVLDYFAKSLETCARKTQVITLYRNEIYERVVTKRFREILEESWYSSAPPIPTSDPNSSQQMHDDRAGLDKPQPEGDTPFRFLEQHRLLDLDGDGYSEPYIVTVEESSKCCVRIVSRFEWDDVEWIDKRIARIKAMEFYTKYSFIPAPDGGVYDLGFGILLGPLNDAVSTGINQIIDSATMRNSNGGFFAKGVKMRGGAYTFAPFTWRPVDSNGDDLRKGIVPFPVNPADPALFQLLTLLIEYTDRLAGTTEARTGENPGQNTPAQTFQGMIEEGGRVYAGIFKRVWRSMKQEFQRRFTLNKQFLPVSKRYGEGNFLIRQEDYTANSNTIAPVADPDVISDRMRVAQAEFIANRAAVVPGYDREEAERRLLQAVRIRGADKVYVGVDKAKPLPNPKLQIEEAKLKGKQMDLEFKKWELIQELQSQRALNMATVDKLKAEAAKIVAGIGHERAELELKAFEMAIGAIQEHNDQMNERIKTLMEGSDGDSKPGGMERLAGPPGNAGGEGAAGAQGGGVQGGLG